MTYPIIQRELTIHLNNGNWYLRPIEQAGILGPVDYGWHRYRTYPDSFTFGEGLLAGSSIPGSRRLVFAGWSPQWDGFYVSSMGGAAYTFHGVGVNYVALRGKAHETSVLLLNHKQGEIQVRMDPINADSLWNGYADREGNPLLGFFALQQALYDRYESEYAPGKMRICTIGPAARFTSEGALGSSPYHKGALSGVVDWAGRGGMGSRLLQNHEVAAIIFGGEWEDPDLRDSKEIDAYFLEHYGQKTIQTDMSVTEKYRYVPQFETGGTFGVNMREMNERVMSFNYSSIYHSDAERLKQHKDFILDHYLLQFNEETIKTKNFQHCGEPCPVACKKMFGIYKKDYEPYHALGPQIGVFDQRAAEKINDYVDAMGFDAIQSGGTLAWIMDLVAAKMIDPTDYGFPSANKMNFVFTDDTSSFDLVQDSAKNAKYAQDVLHAILFDSKATIFKEGIRSAAERLGKKNPEIASTAVFLPHGDIGSMVPNQYWVAGMLSPMPIMGKYYVYYEGKFMPPYELGKKNVERMTYELFNDNSGICRFHRKWAETITDEIIKAHYNLNVDYKKHQYDLAREIYLGECPKNLPGLNERTIDLLLTFLQQWQRFGLKDESLSFWLTRFEQDKFQAAKEWWAEVSRGIDDAFSAGSDSVPDMLTPGQTEKIKNGA